MFDPPPEAKFITNRNPAEPRHPMILGEPLGPRTTPLDIDIDEMNCNSHIQPYIKFVRKSIVNRRAATDQK